MRSNRFRFTVSIIFILSIFIFSGCSGRRVRADYPPEKTLIELRTDQLIEDVLKSLEYSAHEEGPAAVMPGSLRSGTPFTRLEEWIMEQLLFRLRTNHDVYTLSRTNWFEFREGRPLSFQDRPFRDRNVLRNLVVLEIQVSEDEVLRKAIVHIVASNADGRPLPGVMGETQLDFGYGSDATQLFYTEPKSNPYPEGLEERPYDSVDRLAFSLAAELADSYRTGFAVGSANAPEEEVRVVLFPKANYTLSPGVPETIQNALQQAIVSNQGFTCAVSQEDFDPAFEQIDFYHSNQHIFELESSRLTAGTVLLLAEIFPHPGGQMVGVALRAMWRVSPLEGTSRDLIPTNLAGTYLSGFTGKAYLDSRKIQVTATRYPHRYPPAVREPVIGPRETPAPVIMAPSDTRDLDVCFYDFTEVFEKRIYPVLLDAPGVSQVTRLYNLCEPDRKCLCYSLIYTGPQEDLEAWLQNQLRTSQVLTFTFEARGPERLDVIFNAGFE